ncbi:MAG: toll/interleukin-1 receptor domain-containing protein [Vicinamibacterales bacterium]
MAHDVFISHSSKDKPTADAVCARLEGRGLRCWIAPRDVPPGVNYGAAIIDAIRGSRVMVLVLSAHANASRHIPNEIERAVSHGVTVLPFRIEDVRPAKSLDFFIGSVHWLDAMTPPLDRHLDELADSVSRLLAVEPDPPAPVPPVPPVPLLSPSSPRSDVVRLAAVAMAAAVLAVLVWVAVRAGPAPEGERAGPALPTAALIGCWRYANDATVEVREDGTARVGPFDGQWRGSGRRFTLIWPEPVDTLTLSGDGRRLTGGNQYGVSVTASRVGGAPGLSGSWLWGGVVPVDLTADGVARLGPLTGRWTVADGGRRVYRVTWPKIEEQVTLSDDLGRLTGVNQYGVAVSGTRLPRC